MFMICFHDCGKAMKIVPEQADILRLFIAGSVHCRIKMKPTPDWSQYADAKTTGIASVHQ